MTFFFQEWDWAFGQTPEFTYSISRSFGWGNVVSQLNWKIRVCWLDGIVGGENTLKARSDPFMLLHYRGHGRLGVAGEVGPWFRRSKVWFPRQYSDGV